MLSRHTYFKIILTVATCLLAGSLYAQEEGMAEEGMAAEEGMLDEEAMLEEEGMMEELEPFFANEVEIGLGYSSEDSFKFGEYTGLEEEGFFVIGNISLHKRMLQDDGKTRYWDIIGTNLGIDSRSFFANYGQAGKYEVFVDYDQKPHFNLDDAQTPFAGAGTARQTLPAAYDNTDSGTENVMFNGTLHQVDVETQRYKGGGGFSWIPAEHWTVKANYHHEVKDGTETTSVSTNGFTNAVYLITPIEYDADEFDISVSRVGPTGQFELGYHMSMFQNDNKGLLFENPFENGASIPLRGPQQLGLVPDNTAHKVYFKSGYNLGQTTRAMATLSYQNVTQDDTFLPYTVNPNLVGPDGGALVPLPRTNLDGEINYWFANLVLTGRPTRKLGLTGRYTLDYRDSDTPSDTYQYTRTDANDQQDLEGSRARVNKVYDYEKHRAELDAKYRLFSRGSLSAGYEFEYVNRDNSEVEHTYEHTGKVKLSGSPTDRTHGWIKYLHAEKSGSTYDNTVPFFAGFSPEHVTLEVEDECAGVVPLSQCDALYENSSFMRKYYMADRSRDRIASNISFFPDDRFTIGLSGRYTTDDFDDTDIGLVERDVLSATLDLSYVSSEDFTIYGYYTHDFINNEQVGCENCDAVPPPAGAGIEPDRRWEVDNEDHVNTFGTGFEWNNMIEDKLDIGMDFTYTQAVTEVVPKVPNDFVDDGILGFPDIETTIYSLRLYGDYRYNKQTRIRLGYLFEYFKNKDWAFDNVNETTIDRILATGERSPDYSAHVVGLSLIYDFDY